MEIKSWNVQGCCDAEDGCWGVYPFLPSGNLVASDQNNGLFVLAPTYVRGCYLEGVVTDSVTGALLYNATVSLLATGITKQTKFSGEYKTGYYQPGTYSVQFSKTGYYTKTINNVTLTNGVLTNLDVQLVSVLTQVSFSGHVENALTTAPVANAHVHIYNGTGDYPVTADGNGDFTLPVFPGTYSIDAAQWGYHGVCLDNISITGGSPYTIQLNTGYYDDFNFDLGWTNSGNSFNLWERGVSIGTTTNGGTQCAPANDVVDDCRNACMVTDIGTAGGNPWDSDVDNGSATLNSPSFDATLYTDPIVRYERWYFNGGLNNNPADDTMNIYLTNGITTALLESAYPTTSTNSAWLQSNFRIADFLTPTNNMHLIMTVRDTGVTGVYYASLVEGGLDKFEVTESVGIKSNLHNANVIAAYPSPFMKEITLHIAEGVELNNSPFIFEINDF